MVSESANLKDLGREEIVPRYALSRQNFRGKGMLYWKILKNLQVLEARLT